jgi:hypothetical protein
MRSTGEEMPKAIKWTRVFFTVAIIVSAILEAYTHGRPGDPLAQYQISAFAGVIGVAAAKALHVL